MSDVLDTLFGILRLVIAFITVAQAERLEETGALDRYCQLPAAGAVTDASDSFNIGSEIGG